MLIDLRPGSILRRVCNLAFVGLAMILTTAPRAMSDPATKQTGPKSSKTTPHCEVAMVSPVSGHAECVKPPGVPVAPPPKRPDQKLTVKPPPT